MKNIMLSLGFIFLSGCHFEYHTPETPLKKGGYIVVDNPVFIVHGNRYTTERWLNDYHNMGWRLIEYKEGSGEWIFYKEQIK